MKASYKPNSEQIPTGSDSQGNGNEAELLFSSQTGVHIVKQQNLFGMI